MTGSSLQAFFTYLDEVLASSGVDYDDCNDQAEGHKRKTVEIDAKLTKVKFFDGLEDLSKICDNVDNEHNFSQIIKKSKAIQWYRYHADELACIMGAMVESVVVHRSMAPVSLSILMTIVFTLQAASPVLPKIFKLRLNVFEQCLLAYSNVSHINNQMGPLATTPSTLSMEPQLLKLINDVFITEIKCTAKVSFDLHAYRVMIISSLLPWHMNYMMQFASNPTCSDLVNTSISTLFTTLLEMSIASYDAYLVLVNQDLQQHSLGQSSSFSSPSAANAVYVTPQSAYKKNRMPYKDEIKKKIIRSYVWKIDDEAAQYVQLLDSKRKQLPDNKTPSKSAQQPYNHNDDSGDDAEDGWGSSGRKKFRGVDGKVRYWNDQVFEQFREDSRSTTATEHSGDTNLADVHNKVVKQYGNHLSSMFITLACRVVDNNKMSASTRQCIVLHAFHRTRRAVAKQSSRTSLDKDASCMVSMKGIGIYVAFILLVCSGQSSLGYILVDALYSNVLAAIGKATNGSVLTSKEQAQAMLDIEFYTFVIGYASKLLLDKEFVFAQINQFCVLFMESAGAMQGNQWVYEQFSRSLFSILLRRVYDLCGHQHSEASEECIANVKLLLEDYLDVMMLPLPPASILLLYIYVLPILDVPLDVGLLEQVHDIKKTEFEGLGKGLGGAIQRLDEDLFSSVNELLRSDLLMLLTSWPVPFPASCSSNDVSISIPLPQSLSACNLLALYKQALLPLLSPLHHKGGVQIDRDMYNLSLLSLPLDAILNIVQYLPFKKIGRLSSACSSLHDLINVQYEERVWRHVYQSFLTKSVFADKLSTRSMNSAAEEESSVGTGGICHACLDRRIAALEGYDSLREKQDGNLLVVTKAGKAKGKRDVNARCCMSVSTNHSWRLLLKERVQELRCVRKQQQVMKTGRAKAAFRACPVIGCHVVINSALKLTMEQHLEEHSKACLCEAERSKS